MFAVIGTYWRTLLVVLPPGPVAMTVSSGPMSAARYVYGLVMTPALTPSRQSVSDVTGPPPSVAVSVPPMVTVPAIETVGGRRTTPPPWPQGKPTNPAGWTTGGTTGLRTGPMMLTPSRSR